MALTKVLFICHGNICRSPMAEFVMKDMVKKKGMAESFYIESAATSTEELGSPVYRPVRELLNRHEIDCEGKRARQITRSDYADFEMLIGMDEANIRNMHICFGGDSENKIYKLLTFAGEDRDVADPWYTRDFERTWMDVRIGCNALLEYIERYKQRKE